MSAAAPRQLFGFPVSQAAIALSLFAALLFAPWALGATTVWSIEWLNVLLAVGAGCWVFSRGILMRWPKVPIALVISSALVLAIGWWMTLNARALRDEEYGTFLRLHQLLPGLPGSVDRVLSSAMMLRVTLLLVTVVVVADASREPRFLLALWWGIVIAGTSISLLGILQKVTGAEMIFWQRMDEPVTTFFATYFYHANAGAFLNLTWPFTAAMAFRVTTRRSASWLRTILLTSLVIDLVAVMANTSRMANLVAAVLLLIMLWRFLPRLHRAFPATRWRTRIAIGIFLLLIVVAIAYASQWERALARWQTAEELGGEQGRWAATLVGARVAQEAGWIGFGPGTFRVVFPAYATTLEGTSRFLHQDYVQTVIEWGWVGSAFCAFIFFGGVIGAIMRLKRAGRQLLPRQRLIAEVAVIALIGVALHATVDFPLQIASIQLYAAVCLGVCWGSLRWRTALPAVGG